MAESILDAARAGDWTSLLALLPANAAGAQERDDWGRLPLHYAALQPDTPLAVVQALIEAYPDGAGGATAMDEMEQVPLDYAQQKGAPPEVIAAYKEGASGRAALRKVSLGAESTLGEGDEEEGWGDSVREGESPCRRRSSDRASSPNAASAEALRGEMAALKEELTQTALYIVDEVQGRLDSQKEEVQGRVQAQQVVLEGSLQAQTELQSALEGALQAQTAESELAAKSLAQLRLAQEELRREANGLAALVEGKLKSQAAQLQQLHAAHDELRATVAALAKPAKPPLASAGSAGRLDAASAAGRPAAGKQTAAAAASPAPSAASARMARAAAAGAARVHERQQQLSEPRAHERPTAARDEAEEARQRRESGPPARELEARVAAQQAEMGEMRAQLAEASVLARGQRAEIDELKRLVGALAAAPAGAPEAAQRRISLTDEPPSLIWSRTSTLGADAQATASLRGGRRASGEKSPPVTPRLSAVRDSRASSSSLASPRSARAAAAACGSIRGSVGSDRSIDFGQSISADL